MRALVLIAHGSRRREANEDLDWLAAGVRERGLFDVVRTAYLELAEPTIAAATESCVNDGATDVVWMPYFLSPGVHVTQDLEATMAEMRERFVDVQFRLTPPIGRHPGMIDIVCDRIQGVLLESRL